MQTLVTGAGDKTEIVDFVSNIFGFLTCIMWILDFWFSHGGSFSHSSANSAIYDTLCRRLVSVCKAAVVSVNYRRSPEHRFPCAYEDGWAALKWVKSRKWLQSGKESKVYVYMAGDSSGGNIVHHVAVRAAEAAEEETEVLGSILLHQRKKLSS